MLGRLANNLVRFRTTTTHAKFFLSTKSSEHLEEKIQRKYDQQLQNHWHLQTEFPENSLGGEAIDADLAKRKRIIYRSKQRGWLEVDLLLGSWASKNVMNLATEELNEYEKILNLETIHIFNYISGQVPVPQEFAESKMMKRLQEYCASSPLGKASVKGFEENKKHMSN